VLCDPERLETFALPDFADPQQGVTIGEMSEVDAEQAELHRARKEHAPAVGFRCSDRLRTSGFASGARCRLFIRLGLRPSAPIHLEQVSELVALGL
jgi:hypothetical protein